MSKLHVNCKAVSTLYLTFNSQRTGIYKTAARFYKWSPSAQLHHFSTSNFTTQLPHCGCFTRNLNSLYLAPVTSRQYVSAPGNETPEAKLSLYQRFKAMYRDYWYVLLPVHLVTSAGWFSSFYFMASSGVDIVSLLESLHVSDKVINPFRNGHSTTGYIAIAYALYKIATPLRYTVTLGGTTVSINYLRKWGYIKPVPSKEKLKEIYQDRKEIIKEKGQTLKDNMLQTFKTTESKKKSP